MPWVPELFSAPVLDRIGREASVDRGAIPYFAGLRAGETEALLGSFAGEPELHHPIRGRVKGARAFERFATDTTAWLAERNASIEDVNHVITPRRGVEEVVLTLDGDRGQIELPIAIAADRDQDARIIELRVYFSTWPRTGGHAVRPPLLQPDKDIHAPDVVGKYQRALAGGDADGCVMLFERDGYFREPAGAELYPSWAGRDARAI